MANQWDNMVASMKGEDPEELSRLNREAWEELGEWAHGIFHPRQAIAEIRAERARIEAESERRKTASFTRFRIRRGGAIQDFENIPENAEVIEHWKSLTDFCVLVSEDAHQYYGG